jgi:hypothetical protein
LCDTTVPDDPVEPFTEKGYALTTGNELKRTLTSKVLRIHRPVGRSDAEQQPKFAADFNALVANRNTCGWWRSAPAQELSRP